MNKIKPKNIVRKRSAKIGDLVKEIDRGWRLVWRKRGYRKPPWVSPSSVGAFQLPTPSINHARVRKKV
jgi:hypothetical protein